ncbi:uncharacterized protein BDV14DRAFT_57916 [Aspergillus stella-maris]|uniref:uncharacterized protein n=1 Tax=Aspergillus stella-maris TaxID=1810926 RepID=UPI003CCE2A8C
MFLRANYNDWLCIICSERVPSENIIEFPCYHTICDDCVRKLAHFSYPPTCCERPLPEKSILRCISKEEMAALKSRVEERTTPLAKRWYCPDTSCGSWIPRKQLRVKGTRLTRSRTYACPHCNAAICSRCRGHSHIGECPPADLSLAQVLAVARDEKWRKCNRCGMLTEKTDDSCNTMYCQCGATFCYVCGKNRANGRCACYWNEYARTVKTRINNTARAFRRAFAIPFSRPKFQPCF